MPSSTWIISLISLIYYLLLTPPIFYLLFANRHARRTILPYLSVFTFTGLQIAASAILLADARNGVHSHEAYVGLIISTVGIVACIIAAMNVLLLCTSATPGALPAAFTERRLARPLWLAAVIVGTAIGAYGSSNYFGKYPNAPAKALSCYRAGFALVAIGWIVLALLSAYALRSVRQLKGTGGEAKLLWGAALAVAVLVIRIGYLVYCVVEPLSRYGALTENVVIRVVFDFVPGATAALCLVVGGIAASRDVERVDESKTAGAVGHAEV